MASQHPVVALASTTELQNHHKLTAWVVENGGFFHSDVQLAFEATKGFHALVKADKTLSAGTQIASCPTAAVLSVLNALDIEPFVCRGVQFPQRFRTHFIDSPEILQTFFLMEHYLLGNGSWWKHYIATLPSPASIAKMQFDRQEDGLWVRGTNLEAAIQLQLQKWQQDYTIGVHSLRQDNWENAVNGSLSWDLYRWAVTIFGTRSFTSQVLADTRPADLARPLGADHADHLILSKLFSERFAVLLPLLDVLNHKPGAQIEWQARHNFVGLQLLEDYGASQELFNNYGPRDNESLLLSYGFVLPDNPFDHVVVSIRTPPGSPLADARTWPADNRSNDNFNCYIFGHSHPIVSGGSNLERALFSYDLLDSISVLVGNERELQTMYTSQKTLMSICLPSAFSDFRNVLATLSQLMQDCRAKLRRLRMTDPSHSSTPENQIQNNAQIYRNSQMTILQDAISVCAFVVFHASTDLRQEEIVHTMEIQLSEFYSHNIGILLHKFPCLTQQRELLTVDAIMTMLPHDFSMGLQNIIKEATRLMDEREQLPTGHSDIIKGGFAIALGAIGWEYMHRTHLRNELQPRLRTWFNNLTNWYPPSDESWSYVPGSGPWDPDEEPPAALMMLLSVIPDIPNAAQNPWLRHDMLCWGWNVMEEEGVRVPVEIERFCNGIVEATVEEGAIGFLLYCKQY